MILKFQVENFLSIRKPLVFDLASSGLKSGIGQDHLQIPLDKGAAKKVVAIYGANASGKSNFIEALATMANLAVGSAVITPSDVLPYTPFRFDSSSLQSPTRFSLELSLRGVRYCYSYAYDAGGIVSEKLQYAPNHYLILVFERTGESYRFGNEGKTLSPLAERTAKNKLFLGTAASFNVPSCAALYDFFANDLIVDYQNQKYATSAGKNLFQEIGGRLAKEESLRLFVLSVLQASDFNIHSLTPKLVAPSLEEGAYQKGKEEYALIVGHRVKDKEYYLPLEQESDGTISILFLSYFFYLASVGEKLLLVDELDQSLHTLLLPFLVRLFSQRCPTSQLIFTTHDSAILREACLRRDEYYFTEKGEDAATRLFCLSDFSVRREANVEDEYLEGRFGAVPFIKDGFIA